MLVGLWPFLGAVLAIVAGVLVCAAAGRIIERLIVGGSDGRRGLRRRAEVLYRKFRARAAEPGRLAPGQVAAGFAAFSDFQTYLDQRAFRYAGRALDAVEAAAEGGSPGHRGGVATVRAEPDPVPPPDEAAFPPSPAGG